MAAANLLSETLARRYKAVPVGFVSEEILLLAVADPTNVLAVDDIQMMTGLSCRPAIAAEDDIESLIGRLDTLHHAVSEAIEEDEEDGEAEVTELRESAEDAPVIKLVYSILGQAVQEGASDIHFEPGEKDMRVRFRVDGILYEAAHVPRRMVAGVVSRIKIMSDLDIAEKRVPQDGRVSVNVDERKVDLRVTTLPTQRGEGATVRILDKSQALLSLDELGLDGEARERFETSFRKAYGAILVTGPTGLGQVDDSLRRPERPERAGEEHRHDRGPGRVPAPGDQPDQRQPPRRPRLRDRAALDPARRSRRDHGRRDPRLPRPREAPSRLRSPATWC